MKRFRFGLITLCLFALVLSGCKDLGSSYDGNESGDSSFGQKEGESQGSVNVDFSKTDADMFTDRDQRIEYDKANAVNIQLKGNSAVADSDSVRISGSRITITEEATYVISGELSDGMLVVDANDTAKLQLIFNGVSITNKTSAALYVLEADKVFLTLADGTDNVLENGGSFDAIDDNNVDGALFSKQDLSLNGTGKLTVYSPVGHGIVCKDDLVICGGNYVINSASHGLDANDSVRIVGATLDIDAGKDAIHSENSDDPSLGFVYISSGNIKAEAEGDGISAGSYLQIADGTIDLLVGGGSENGSKEQSDFFGGFMGGGKPGGMSGGMRPKEGYAQTASVEDGATSMKGIKAVSGILICDGKITVDSADDAIHSDASILIDGGEYSIASGDDAVHAEDTLTVTAGKINISESYEGLEALHIDIRGGEIKLKADDDGLNAAGGVDQSGMTGGRDGMFGGDHGGGGPGGRGGAGGMSSNSNGSIKISGGVLYIHSSGDGMDANGTLEISGGHTTVVGPTQGDTATLDYDKSATITGGTFIGTGAAGMAQTFSDSEQGVVSVSVGNQAAGTKIVLTDKNGKVLFDYSPELNFAVVILSDPELVKGETYTVSVGSAVGEFEAS